ncbi:MAG: hypothetical protein ACFCGT_15020 [Sandaracinaceae bacterium]
MERHDRGHDGWTSRRPAVGIWSRRADAVRRGGLRVLDILGRVHHGARVLQDSVAERRERNGHRPLGTLEDAVLVPVEGVLGRVERTIRTPLELFGHPALPERTPPVAPGRQEVDEVRDAELVTAPEPAPAPPEAPATPVATEPASTAPAIREVPPEPPNAKVRPVTGADATMKPVAKVASASPNRRRKRANAQALKAAVERAAAPTREESDAARAPAKPSATQRAARKRTDSKRTDSKRAAAKPSATTKRTDSKRAGSKRAGSKGRGLPIPGYERLTVKQVLDRLPGLTEEERRAVMAFERTHKKRKTLLRVLEARSGR